MLIHVIAAAAMMLTIIGCQSGKDDPVTPNQFRGSDIERIQAAVNAAAGTTNTVTIPRRNNNGTNIWLVDSAVLLPGNMTVILDNCTIQLSDQSRDNMFRSNNAGQGIEEPVQLENIHIIGQGNVLLKGAENPRSTGDGARTLTLNPDSARAAGNWRVSYGSDAAFPDRKQKGDWRNIMILMAYVDGFTLKNVSIEKAHAWAISFERTRNADLSDIRFDCRERQVVNGREIFISNRDGIDLRHGCKNFSIHHLRGHTEDDFIALSILGLHSENPEGGTLNSTMVTSRKWHGPEDDIEHVYISDVVCEALTRGVAIRANDSASINHVYIDGLNWKGRYNTILLGGKGYGKPSLPGRIHNVHAMNITGHGRSLVQIEEPVASCTITNGIFTGEGDFITWTIPEAETRNVIISNLIRNSAPLPQ